MDLSHDRIDPSLGERSALGSVLTVFGAAALVLAANGLFGVTGHMVAERSPEMGIRRALGASRKRILWFVLSETAAVVAFGMVAGLLLAWLGRGCLQKFLSRPAPRTPSLRERLPRHLRRGAAGGGAETGGIAASAPALTI